jgi:Flp pilus assembly protein TadB
MCNDLSLQYCYKRDMFFQKKKEREKKIAHIKVQEKNNNKSIAMSLCFPNKGQRYSWKECFIFVIHFPNTCTVLINSYDLSSPWIQFLVCNIYIYICVCVCVCVRERERERERERNKCMLPNLLPWAPHKPTFRSRMKRGIALVRTHTH